MSHSTRVFYMLLIALAAWLGACGDKAYPDDPCAEDRLFYRDGECVCIDGKNRDGVSCGGDIDIWGDGDAPVDGDGDDPVDGDTPQDGDNPTDGDTPVDGDEPGNPGLWPMYRGDAGRTARSVSKGPEVFTRQQLYLEVQPHNRSGPVVDSLGNVYLAQPGHMTSWSKTGKLRLDEASESCNQPSYPMISQDGKLYYFCRDGTLIRFLTDSGYMVDVNHFQPQAKELTLYQSHPAIDADDRVYAIGPSNILQVANVAEPIEWDEFIANSYGSAPVVADDGSVYILGDYLECFAANGDELWSRRISGSYASQPMLLDGVLYFFEAGWDDDLKEVFYRLIALDATDGTERWTKADFELDFTDDGFVEASLAASQSGDIFLGVGMEEPYDLHYAYDHDNKPYIIKLDPDGELLWQYQLTRSNRVCEMAVDRADWVYFITNQAPTGRRNLVGALNQNGKLVFQEMLNEGGPVTRLALGSDGVLFVVVENDTYMTAAWRIYDEDLIDGE